MTVFVERRGVSAETLFRRYGRTAFIIDVTSYSTDPQWRRFSPFYVHAGPIPIPYSPEGWVSRTVEGLWQGLKVGRDYRIDSDKFQATSSKGLKRKFAPGELLGHRKGVRGEILGYIPVIRLLYLPSYRFVLEQYLSEQVAMLRYMAEQYPVVLLDVFTNGDIDDPRTPLSHAALLKRFLDRLWSPYDEMGFE